MKILPLTALVFEGPMARAYLSHLRANDYRLEHIILMVQKRDVATKKLLAPWLPSRFRQRYAEYVQDFRMNYWPRQLTKQFPELIHQIKVTLKEALPIEDTIFADLTAKVDYQAYADRVSRVFVDGLKAPSLLATLKNIPEATVLDCPHLKFLHIHPGFLPDVRGSDGLLWSTLVRGCPGVSCFYMDPGIDTGNIIVARDYPAITFSLSDTMPPISMLYRAVYSFYDPIIRACLFIEVISKYPTLRQIPNQAQSVDDGTTYRFMAVDLREKAFMKIFIPKEI